MKWLNDLNFFAKPRSRPCTTTGTLPLPPLRRTRPALLGMRPLRPQPPHRHPNLPIGRWQVEDSHLPPHSSQVQCPSMNGTFKLVIDGIELEFDRVVENGMVKVGLFDGDGFEYAGPTQIGASLDFTSRMLARELVQGFKKRGIDLQK